MIESTGLRPRYPSIVVKTMEKLGILVNSTAHNHSVIQLARAARVRGKTVDIFLAAQGVRILGHPLFRQLARIGRVWVCSASIEALQTDTAVSVPEACHLVPPGKLAEFLRACYRHVVFSRAHPRLNGVNSGAEVGG